VLSSGLTPVRREAAIQPKLARSALAFVDTPIHANGSNVAADLGKGLGLITFSEKGRGAAMRPIRLPVAGACMLLIFGGGCATVKRMAINRVGDSIAQSSTTYAADNDPDFVGAALPSSLKQVEGLLAQSPKHRGLLFTAASGFTQYTYAYVQQDADVLETEDLERASQMRDRGRRLYLRARDYGLRGLDVQHRGFSEKLTEDPKAAVRIATRQDVPMLYWTAASWGAAIAVSQDHPDLVADQPIVEALIDRAFELNPDYDFGAIHGFLIKYEMARQGAAGDPAARARQHFDREVALTNRQLASPYVSFAESVCVPNDNRQEFEKLLGQALAIDPDARPEWRLQNLVTQKRAKWLLTRTDELFVK
jgi:predicted anti-sigma-YlaC factor YlaD